MREVLARRMGVPVNVGRVVVNESGGTRRDLGINDARSSVGGDNTRKLGAVKEVVVVARLGRSGGGATALGGVHVGVATIAEIGIVGVAITVGSGAAIGTSSETNVGNAARNLTKLSRRGASGHGLEVTGVPVVEGIAVLGVRAVVSVALADINEVRGLSGHLTISSNRVNETASSKVGIVGGSGSSGDADVGQRLGQLPGVAGGRATTTTTSGLGDSTGTDLVGETVLDPAKRGGEIPLEAGEGSSRGSDVRSNRIIDTIDALSRARRPVRPGGELTVLLEADKLVGALDAGSNGSRRLADADLVEGSLDEGDTTDIIEGRSVADDVLEVVGSGERNLVNVESITAIVLEVRVATTVVGALGGAAVTGLNGDVAEDTLSLSEVPEVTAVIGVRAHGPGRPRVELSLEGGDIRVGPVLVLSSLAAVVQVAVLVGATGLARGLRLALPVRLVGISNTIPNRASSGLVAILEDVQLVTLDARLTAETVGLGNGDATITIAIEIAVVAGEIAETGGRSAKASGVAEVVELLTEVGAITRNDARGIVLPGDGALSVRMLPRKDRMVKLSRATELNINRAEVAAGLATVAGIVIAIEEAFLALIDAVSGPAVLVGEVVDGVPEREVAAHLVPLTIPLVRTAFIDSVIVLAVAVSVDPGDAVDVGGPVTTVASRGNLISAEVNVDGGSEGGVPELSAIVRRARVIVALPVLFVEHTSIGDEGETSDSIELVLEALTLAGSTNKNGTSTNADTTSPVTVASSGALRPRRPGSDVALNPGVVGLVGVRASADGDASEEATISVVGVDVGKIGRSVRGTILLDTGPGEVLGVVDLASLERSPSGIDVPVNRVEVEDLHDVKGDLTLEVVTSVVNRVAKTTTVSPVSTKVTLISVAGNVHPGETIDHGDGVLIRVAVGEAVEVLNDGKVANTTARGGSENLAGANASLEDVVLVDAVIGVGAETPVRPLREDAVNGLEVGLTNDGKSSRLGRIVDGAKVSRSVVEEGDVDSSEH